MIELYRDQYCIRKQHVSAVWQGIANAVSFVGEAEDNHGVDGNLPG